MTVRLICAGHQVGELAPELAAPAAEVGELAPALAATAAVGELAAGARRGGRG